MHLNQENKQRKKLKKLPKKQVKKHKKPRINQHQIIAWKKRSTASSSKLISIINTQIYYGQIVRILTFDD
jgi:hypothetical protein